MAKKKNERPRRRVSVFDRPTRFESTGRPLTTLPSLPAGGRYPYTFVPPDFSALELRVASEFEARRGISDLDLIRVDEVLLVDSIRAGAIEHVSMGARVGYTDCPACPNGRTDRNNEHWHRPMVADVAARLALMDSSRTERTLQDAMDEAFARGEEGICVINTNAIRKIERISSRRPHKLGELLKKGGLDIDAVINSRYTDYYPRPTNRVCKPGEHRAFADYLKKTFNWFGVEARYRWRALVDLHMNPRQLLQKRYRLWLTTQNSQ